MDNIPDEGSRDVGERVPHNLDAEQAVLGGLLFDNQAIEQLPTDLKPEHFFEPFHSRLFRSILSSHRAGLATDGGSLDAELRADRAYKQMGGIRYLGDLLDKAPPANVCAGYAEEVLQLAIRRSLIQLAANIDRGARYDYRNDDGDKIDARALVDGVQATLTRLQSTTVRDAPTSLYEAVTATVAYIEDPTPPSGAFMGLRPIDRSLGPMMAGDLFLLGGRPSMGKSAIGLAASLNVAAPEMADWINGLDYDGREARGVLEFHGEMSFGGVSGGQVAHRHLTDIGYREFGTRFPTYQDIRNKKRIGITELSMVRHVAEKLRGVPAVGLKRSGLRLSTLRTLARRQFAIWEREGIKPGLITVDHVGLLRGERSGAKRYEEQSEISQGLKELADELGVPILALVQLSRDLERRDDKRPMMADLRDSGRYEEDADFILFVYRDAYYAQREKAPDENKKDGFANYAEWESRCKSKDIELIIAKARVGDAARCKIWGDLAWNAVRGASPDLGGIFAS